MLFTNKINFFFFKKKKKVERLHSEVKKVIFTGKLPKIEVGYDFVHHIFVFKLLNTKLICMNF